MIEKYFYLALTPTANALAFIYSRTFKIKYNSSSDLIAKQSKIETEFRSFNGNPKNYNSQWSVDYDEDYAANSSRKSEIDNLKNSGKVVKESNFPETIAA